MKTVGSSGGRICNCRRGMIIIFTLFILAVSASVYVLVLLYRSVG